MFYGKENNLVNNDYCLIVNEDKKFKVEGNKIYVEEIVKDLSDYSFVSIDRNMMGYKVGNIKIDNELYSALEKENVKDYTGDIKKYLNKNKEKFNDLKIIDKVINLL